ncbi:MAG TPA: hypothetical protein VFQ78_05035 [Candidatus Udaeobacter sp.]|nr:hypothetical protein [Candidatus Udaeobacter sp.]
MSKEIRFDCPHCSAPVVIDSAAIPSIKLLDCKRCRKSIRIPRSVIEGAASGATQPTPPPSPSIPPKAASPTTATPPPAAAPPANAANITQPNDPLADVKRRLKENESQRTEVTGHINQLNIQLHRWQLRLNMLNDRQKELEKEIAAGKTA